MFSKTHYGLFKPRKINISHQNLSQGIFLFCRIDIFKLAVDVCLPPFGKIRMTNFQFDGLDFAFPVRTKQNFRMFLQ